MMLEVITNVQTKNTFLRLHLNFELALNLKNNEDALTCVPK